MNIAAVSPADVYAALASGEEIALIDVREESAFQKVHATIGVSIPLSKLELEVLHRIPRRTVSIILYDDDGSLIYIAAQRMNRLGYANVRVLSGGLAGWEAAGCALSPGSTQNKAPQKSNDSLRISQWLKATQERYFPERVGSRSPSMDIRSEAAVLGVTFITNPQLEHLIADDTRTFYGFDLRSSEEFAAGHIPGFKSVSPIDLADQLEHHSAVHGARIVLHGATETQPYELAKHLAGRGRDIYVLDEEYRGHLNGGHWRAELPAMPSVQFIDPDGLASRIKRGDIVVLDLAEIAEYRAGHIPGAWFTIRAEIPTVLHTIPAAKTIAVTSEDGLLAKLASSEIQDIHGQVPLILRGGTAAWVSAGLALEIHKTWWGSIPDETANLTENVDLFSPPTSRPRQTTVTRPVRSV